MSPRTAITAGRRTRVGAAVLAALATLAACDGSQPVAPTSPDSPELTLRPRGTGAVDLPPTISASMGALSCGATDPIVAMSRAPRGPNLNAALFPGAGTLTSGTGFAIVDMQMAGGRTEPNAVNDLGQVAGSVLLDPLAGRWNAFAWTSTGGYAVIAPLAGDVSSFGMGNNNAGLVVGYSSRAGLTRAFTSSGGGAATALPQAFGGDSTVAYDVSNTGLIVGHGRLSAGANHRAFVYDGATYTALIPAGWTRSYGTAISGNGRFVAGWGANAAAQQQPFVYDRATSQYVVGALPGGAIAARAFGVNASGDVVGWAVLPGNVIRGFHWPAGGSPSLVGPLPGGGELRLWAINDNGLAAGYGVSAGTGGIHAVRYSLGAGLVDLGKRPGACSSYGYGINSDGDIAGKEIVDPNVVGSVWPIPAPPAPRYTLGDRVWLDVDGDGAQDGGEAGIGGVTVTLADAASNPLGTTVTAADGTYTFTNLLAGAYKVCVSNTPAGHAQTFDLDGLSTAHCATLMLSSNRADVDFGYTPPPRYTLGDRVWLDADGDGAQDAGETGINGVTLTLSDALGNVLATTTTAGDGVYGFANLLAGTYKVCASGLPANHAQTFDLDGVATANCATLALSANRADVDFGYAPPPAPRYTLGDRVWLDADGDGVQDAGEAGIAGVTVTLTDAANAVIGAAVTAADGTYTIGNLLAGAYKACVSNVPANHMQTYDLDGVATAGCASLTLSASRTDVDFGYWKGLPPVPTISSKTDGSCTAKPTVTFSVADADGATNGPWAYTVTWGDGTTSTGSATTLGQAITVTKDAQYASGGPFTVTVKVTDKHALEGTTTTSVSSTSHSCGTKPPEVKYLEADCKCGKLPVVTFKVADADGASNGPWKYTVSWGDGTTSTGTATTLMSLVTVTKPKAFPTNKTYTVTVTVTDASGLTATASDQMVNDCADANDLPYPKYVEIDADCGKAPKLTFKVYDADGSADDFTYTVNWGDGTTSTGSVSTTMTLVTVTKAAPYAANGTYQVVVTVKDKLGEVGTVTVTEKVACTTPSNLPPIVKYMTAEAKCSKLPTVTFKVYDADSDAPWTYTVAWGDGTTSTGTVTKEMDYVTVTKAEKYAANKSYTVTVTAKDKLGASGSASDAVTYACAKDPLVAKIQALTATVACKSTAKIAASFTDGDTDAKPWSYVVEWGDGAKDTGKMYSTGSLSDDESHTYATGGTYTVKFTVTNADGETSSATTTITVTCAPTGGVCTRTQGYWKNHESAWPKPLSPNADFMRIGGKSKSWGEVLDMPPSGGNSYLQLAHQWIAATLNVANGVKPSEDVLKTIVAGGAWLLVKTNHDGSIPTISDAQATAWAAYLDKFNNGQLGTPHCN